MRPIKKRLVIVSLPNDQQRNTDARAAINVFHLRGVVIENDVDPIEILGLPNETVKRQGNELHARRPGDGEPADRIVSAESLTGFQ